MTMTTSARRILTGHTWKLLLIMITLWMFVSFLSLIFDENKLNPLLHVSKMPDKRVHPAHRNKVVTPVNFLNRTPSPVVWCFNKKVQYTSEMIPPFNGSISDRPRIFFVETSCRSQDAGHIVLNSRQACSIESAAKTNPNSDIFVLLISQGYVNVTEDTASNRILKEVQSFSNVYIRHIDLLSFTKDTILEDWYQTEILKISPYALTHTSDMLRLLILWKYGGTYLDLDTVVTVPLEELGENYVGAETLEYAGSGVLNFNVDGIGHSFVEYMLYDFRDNYNPNNWGNNGPAVVSRALLKFCGSRDPSEMTREKCQNIMIYPPETFYPIPWQQWELFFDTSNTTGVMSVLKNSKIIHVWNNLSKNRKIDVGSDAPYSLLAKEYCPKVYKESAPSF